MIIEYVLAWINFPKRGKRKRVQSRAKTGFSPGYSWLKSLKILQRNETQSYVIITITIIDSLLCQMFSIHFSFNLHYSYTYEIVPL